MWVTSSLANVLTPTAIALGNFDGLHLGHQFVIDSLPDHLPSENRLASEDHLSSEGSTPEEKVYRTVVAFDPHPQEFFTRQSRQLLTPLPEKVQILEALQVDQLVLLPFNEVLAGLSPEAFVRDILVRQLQARHVSVGFNFFFGRDRAGNAEDLKAIAHQYGTAVTINQAQNIDDHRISSSSIRELLETHQLDRANVLLGRPYQLTGTVVTGQQLGRTLGFPTANLEVPANKFLPSSGVYSVRVQGHLTAADVATGCQSSNPGVMNIGVRPTVDGQALKIEVHLFDWSGDLYGQTLTVSLETFLRPEQKFESLADLQVQIHQDCDTARAHFASVV